MWKSRSGEVRTVQDIVMRNSGLTVEELLTPRSDSHIVNLDKAAALIKSAIESKTPITVFGDYDADGITGSAILYLTLFILGNKPTVRLPRRFTEGYGLKPEAVAETEPGLIITIDNGITSIDAISKAKELGNTVVVIDHHIMSDDGQLPPADVIVDPQVYDGGDFNDFCGAGLAYRLACLLLDNEAHLKSLSTIACIGTVADVVPLIHDNRHIVIEGLKAINQSAGPVGLYALIRQMGLFDVDETDIGFSIAPALNAPGRLYDDGASLSFDLLVKKHGTANIASEIIGINKERKALQVNGMETIENIISDECLFGDVPLVLCGQKSDIYPEIKEGIAGILAGNVARQYKRPAFVLTKTAKEGVLKGSGRSFGDVHLKALLDSVSEYLESYGGHQGAAGLSVRESNLEAFKRAMSDKLDADGFEIDNNEYFDLEVDASDVGDIIIEMRQYAPYGEGNPRIVLKIANQLLCPGQKNFYSYMGADNQHIRLYCGRGLSAVGFGLADKFNALGEPMQVDYIGTASRHKYIDPADKKYEEDQIQIIDIKSSNIKNPPSELQQSLTHSLKGILGE